MIPFSEYCVCPECGGVLALAKNALHCTQCGQIYEIKDAIPVLLPKYNGDDAATRVRYLENYERLARDDLDESIESPRYRLYRQMALLKFIGNVKGKRVLDIGSSYGQYLNIMDAGFKVAFDIALPYLRTISPSSQIVAICGDAEWLPFKRGFFDVIILSDVLEHILHPENLVRRLEQICTPQTRLIIHVPWEENLQPYQDSEYEFVHLRSFNDYTFKQLFYNFDIKKTKPNFPDMRYPLLFNLRKVMPLWLYNILTWRYFHVNGVVERDLRWRQEKLAALPKNEWLWLWFFKPVFRMFELHKR